MTLYPPKTFIQRISKDSVLNIDRIAAFAAAKSYNNYMCNIGISGETGVGKSTLAIWLGIRLDQDFKSGKYIRALSEHVAYTRYEIVEKAQKLPKHSYLLIDEAIGAFKRRAMESIQKDVVELVNKIRYRNHVIVWNLPFFTDLDSAIRKHFDIWIHVVERGRAAVLLKNRNILAEDPWLPEWWVAKWKKKALATPDEVMEMLREHPLYAFTLRFPPLPPRLQEIYDRFSEEAKSKLESEEKAQKVYLKMLKTTTPKMVEMYVLMTIALGNLMRSGKVTVQDLRQAFAKDTPIKGIRETVAGVVRNPQWYPPDATAFAKHILKKYDYYVGT